MVSVKIWTEISAERLGGNFTALQQLLGQNTALLAIIKANAYGHGINPCAAILASAGAKWLGVTDAHEGVQVREALAAAGARQVEILVMCGTVGLAGEADLIVQHRLTAVIWEPFQVEQLAKAARTAAVDTPVKVHLEVDSGMSRQGAAPGAALDAVLSAIRDEPLVELAGVFTHFASTEVAASDQTSAQQINFEAAIAQVIAAGMRPGWVHVGNSSYIDNGPDCGWLQQQAAILGARAMVRSGLALYGYILPIEGQGSSQAAAKLLPVMSWKTRVIAMSEVPVGARIGYNGTFTAERPMRLALLPVGYADGLRRELSSSDLQTGGWVIIRGHRAPIVGRVSMNLTTVDLSEIADVTVGEEALLLGDGITADDHARLAGTIAYEIVCGVRT